MKNKKKKITAIVLSAVIVVVGAITAIFAIPTRLNGGTETAKILLARERLDEKIFSKEIDFYKQVNNEIPSALKLPASADAGREVSLSVSDAEAPISYNKNKGEAIDNGEYVEWKNFPARSSMMLQIRNWFRDIELEAGRIADIIAKIKNGVGVTDKWIGFGGEECLLTVKDNAEVLIRRDLTYVGDYRVAKRYTRADAKNVYETFSYYNYTDGTTGEIRTVYIPNERYEFLYDNSNGFNDYIIAENSRGYWAVLRMNTIDGNSYSIDTTILKDGLGYNASINIDSNSAKPSACWYEVYDVANSIDILRYAPYENRVETNVYFSALNGIKSVRTTPEQRDMIYTGRDGLEFHDVQPLIINTEKGELPLTKHKDVEYSSAHVSYNPQDWYYEGWITLQLYGNESYTPSDYIEKL
ncbi:MAG: hypothetical protein IKZ38_04910, partial [Clostridia bacterium]|nr:hypothetical protein [Clostridia bacterium]